MTSRSYLNNDGKSSSKRYLPLSARKQTDPKVIGGMWNSTMNKSKDAFHPKGTIRERPTLNYKVAKSGFCHFVPIIEK